MRFKGLLTAWLMALPVFVTAADWSPVAEFAGTVPGNLVQGTTDGFGSSVKLNGDWAFVGAPIARPFGEIVGGVVYVYKKNKHGEWAMDPFQTIQLPGVSHHLGLFKVESQGDWLFISCIGTPVADTGLTVGDFKGAVLVYKYNHSAKEWQPKQQIDSTTIPGLANLVPISTLGLNPTNPPYDNEQGASFGLSFAVDVDDGHLIVGAQYQTTDLSIINVGAIYTFELQGGSWVLKQTLTSPDGIVANDTFGAQIAIKDKIAIVSNGSVFQAPKQSNSAVYVYVYKNGQWEYRQKVTGNQTNQIPVTFLLFASPVVQIGDTFGSALALSEKWAVIGAAFENNGTAVAQGAAYFFSVDKHAHQPLTFFQKVLSTDNNPIGQNFSMTSVAVRNELAVISNIAQTGPTGTLFAGGANVYRYANGAWQFETILFDPLAQDSNWFSGSVDLDTKHVFVGSGFQGINQLIVGTPPLAITPDAPPAQWPYRHAVIFEIPKD